MRKINPLAVLGVFFVGMTVSASPVRSSVAADEAGVCPFLEIPSASEYVQDGLVAMWDGIENVGLENHDFYATEWIDLAQGAVLPVPIDGLRYWKKDCFWRLGNWQVGVSAAPSLNAEFNGEWTVETVFSLEGISSLIANRNVCSFSSYDIRCPLLRDDGHASLYIAGVFEYSTGVAMPFPRTTFTISRQGKLYSLYVNGILIFRRTSSSTADHNPTNVFVTQNYMQDADGKWGTSDNCAIRVYNRALTDEEVEYNYLLDAVRFGM